MISRPMTTAAPRRDFQGDNLARNLALVDRVGEVAKENGCKPSQLALAWVLAQGDDIVPIPARSRNTLKKISPLSTCSYRRPIWPASRK